MHARRLDIDLLRSLAVAMMILYHLAYDLWAFHGWDIDPLRGGWWLLARTTATLFLSLVGISFALSWERHARSHSGDSQQWTIYRKYLRRSCLLLACGMLVSAATYLFEPATYVRFGILHLIGTSVLLLPLFARLGEWNAAIGLLVIAAGMLVSAIRTSTSILLPLGFAPASLVTLDYFPLLPWFGVVLVGLALGLRLPPRERLSRPRRPLWIALLTWPGRHALLLYLVHQPVMLLSLRFLFSSF